MENKEMALVQQPGLVDAKPTTMTLSTFAAKFGTKGEIYRFLATEAMIYLPPYQTVTIWHLKDLAASKKKVSFESLIERALGHLQRGS